jgi:hypothetical protein
MEGNCSRYRHKTTLLDAKLARPRTLRHDLRKMARHQGHEVMTASCKKLARNIGKSCQRAGACAVGVLSLCLAVHIGSSTNTVQARDRTSVDAIESPLRWLNVPAAQQQNLSTINLWGLVF